MPITVARHLNKRRKVNLANTAKSSVVRTVANLFGLPAATVEKMLADEDSGDVFPAAAVTRCHSLNDPVLRSHYRMEYQCAGSGERSTTSCNGQNAKALRATQAARDRAEAEQAKERKAQAARRALEAAMIKDMLRRHVEFLPLLDAASKADMHAIIALHRLVDRFIELVAAPYPPAKTPAQKDLFLVEWLAVHFNYPAKTLKAIKTSLVAVRKRDGLEARAAGERDRLRLAESLNLRRAEAAERKRQQEFDMALIPSWEVPGLLGITRTEYARWCNQGLIPIHSHREFKKWGKTLSFALHLPNLKEIVTRKMIAEWRDDHAETVSVHRIAGARKGAFKAAETRALKEALGCAHYHEQFPIARTLKRHVTVCLGPTNSGKTHHALQALLAAKTGAAAFPLRLLALEAFDMLVEAGVRTSLVTGDERIIDPWATHVCSTVEMLDMTRICDCILIDEVQNIADRERGWAWVAALLGAPAANVFVCGALHAAEAVREILAPVDDVIENRRFERKCELRVLREPVPESEIGLGDAVIVFSRREVLQWDQRLRGRGFATSVLYGALPPPVRRRQAQRFRKGESDVIVSTDCVGQGCNAPIRRVLFQSLRKFNGESIQMLTPCEAQQIAGRAGRFGMHDVGFVGMLASPGGESGQALQLMQLMASAPPAITGPFQLRPSWAQIELVMKIRRFRSVALAIENWSSLNFGPTFCQPDVARLLMTAQWIENYSSHRMNRADVFAFAGSPFDVGAPDQREILEQLMAAYCNGYALHINTFLQVVAGAGLGQRSQAAERNARVLGQLAWVASRYPSVLADADLLSEVRRDMDAIVEACLDQKQRPTASQAD